VGRAAFAAMSCSACKEQAKYRKIPPDGNPSCGTKPGLLQRTGFIHGQKNADRGAGPGSARNSNCGFSPIP
jgi:hypothetical protein